MKRINLLPRIKEKSYNSYLYIGYFLLLLVAYLPLISYGGFGTSDDLALIELLQPDWRTEFIHSLTRPGHVSRPIYALIQLASLYLFEKNPIPYTIFRLAIWGLTLVLCANIFEGFFGRLKTKLFILLYSFPIFTSAHFFNCFQTGYLFSLFFWLLSLRFIKGTFQKNGSTKLGWSALFMVLSLLSCEIMFPLFLLNIGLPVVYALNNKEIWERNIAFVKRYLGTIIIINLCFFIFKIYIAPTYQNGDILYGVGFNKRSFFQSLYYCFAIIVEIPILLLSVLKHIGNSILIGLLLIIFPLSYCYHWLCHKMHQKETKLYDIHLIILYGITLLACAIIFLISGYPASTYGNYNKMLLPAFVIICLLMTYILAYMIKRNYWVIAGLFCFLWVASMVVQIQNFNKSWAIRKEILLDNAKKINETKLGINPIVLSNVPFFIDNNYNNEHLFWLSWDYIGGLKYAGLKKTVKVFPFCWQTLMNRDYYSISNVNRLLEKRPTNNLWVYEYNLKEKTSVLKKIKSLEMYKKEQMALRLNYHPLIEREFLREYLKKIVKSKS